MKKIRNENIVDYRTFDEVVAESFDGNWSDALEAKAEHDNTLVADLRERAIDEERYIARQEAKMEYSENCLTECKKCRYKKVCEDFHNAV